ncbi:Uncharacterized protein FKW44_015495, partial [Caligus rogercresseyi]
VVSTLLHAKWAETDIIAEAMEYLEGGPFWEYFEHAAESSLHRDSHSDQEVYADFMEFAS